MSELFNNIGNSSISLDMISPERLTGFSIDDLTIISATGSLPIFVWLTILMSAPILIKTSMIPVLNGLMPIDLRMILELGAINAPTIKKEADDISDGILISLATIVPFPLMEIILSSIEIG